MNGRLTIDLKAIQENYKTLDKLSDPLCETAAVVKANAYGLGADKVVHALFDAGARTFFVATVDEGIEIRRLLRESHIYVFGGFWKEEAAAYKGYTLVPVLNSITEIAAYVKTGNKAAILHFDTGMNRLGIPPDEAEHLFNNKDVLNALNIHFIMSHLCSSEEPDNETNAKQLQIFQKVTKNFPKTKLSLSNSGGVLLGKDYHFDLTRPGIALYGIGKGMKPVVSLDVPVLQVHSVKAGETAGYNETYTFEKNGHVAVVGAGYADGLPRSLSNSGALWWNGYRLPIRGRVSMDTIICDLSGLPHNEMPHIGDNLEVIGENQTLETLATDAGTIPYEILTALGDRYAREYI